MLLIGASLLAASPSLHQYLHEVSGTASESCVMCVLAHGLFDAPISGPAFAVLILSLLLIAIVPVHSIQHSCPDLRLSPDRGPPSFTA